jgi:hypothetical protein
VCQIAANAACRAVTTNPFGANVAGAGLPLVQTVGPPLGPLRASNLETVIDTIEAGLTNGPVDRHAPQEARFARHRIAMGQSRNPQRRCCQTLIVFERRHPPKVEPFVRPGPTNPPDVTHLHNDFRDTGARLTALGQSHTVRPLQQGVVRLLYLSHIDFDQVTVGPARGLD